MTLYKLTSQAYQDLSKIADYTLVQWGLRQSRLCRDKLNDSFNMLSENPSLGRDVSEYQPGLKRFPVEQHSVFHLIVNSDILIFRILGDRMDYKQHL